jgi:hypothetical protein
LLFFVSTQALIDRQALRPPPAKSKSTASQPLFFLARLRYIKIDKANKLKNIMV